MVFLSRFRFASDLRHLTKLAAGAFISTVIPPVIALIDRALASLLFPGAIAALNYAFLLFLLPASLCVVPLSTVLLTDLAGFYHQGNLRALRRQTSSALRLVLLLTIPIALLSALLAEPLVRLVYEYGRFQTADTLRTAQALRAYVLGLPFYGSMHLLNRSFYALQDTMTPALVGIGALGLNVIGDLICMQLFSHWGIALARSVTLLATAVTLYVLFQLRCAKLITPPKASEANGLDSSNQVS